GCRVRYRPPAPPPPAFRSVPGRCRVPPGRSCSRASLLSALRRRLARVAVNLGRRLCARLNLRGEVAGGGVRSAAGAVRGGGEYGRDLATDVLAVHAPRVEAATRRRGVRARDLPGYEQSPALD